MWLQKIPWNLQNFCIFCWDFNKSALNDSGSGPQIAYFQIGNICGSFFLLFYGFARCKLQYFKSRTDATCNKCVSKTNI